MGALAGAICAAVDLVLGLPLALLTNELVLGAVQGFLTSIQDQIDYLAKGAVDLIEKKDLKSKIERGKPLTVKPTDPANPPVAVTVMFDVTLPPWFTCGAAGNAAIEKSGTAAGVITNATAAVWVRLGFVASCPVIVRL